MSQTNPSIIILGTYFGKWPAWFPAFILSCAKSSTIQWLFFTDCEIPQAPYPNIRYVNMDLGELNELASKKLGFLIQKETYSQVDLQPAYGVIYEDYIEGYDFWGHCDFDVVWGEIRSFFTEEILNNNDIVSGRKDFLSGHLTLWRNDPEVNLLFTNVPNYREILSCRDHHGFDESVISIYIKDLIDSGDSKISVHWLDQIVAGFDEYKTPLGWYWENGKIFDAKHHEHIYLHFQHWYKFEWKNIVSSIDFNVGDQPDYFQFTRSGIRSRRPSIRDRIHQLSVRHDLNKSIIKLSGDIKYALRVVKRLLLIRNIYWAQKLAEESISARDVRYNRREDSLFIRRLNLNISRQQHFLLDNYYLALQLVDQQGAIIYNDEQNELITDVAGLRVSIQSAEEVLVLKRLLVDGIYNLNLPHPTVVLDVGMNVGVVPLYFANKPEVVVVGCEPCQKTYHQALRNISLNPGLANKIQTFRVGIGDSKYKTIAMFYQNTENQTRRTVALLDNYGFPVMNYEEIQIQDIAHMVAMITNQYPERDIFLIIDYETQAYHIDGLSEYHLITRLHATGKLNFIHAIMMEWHSRDPHLLSRQLSDFGFRVLLFSPDNPHEGMLYAVRDSCDEAPQAKRKEKTPYEISRKI